MSTPVPPRDSFRFTAPPDQCGYLPDRQSVMDYRWFDELSADEFEWLLERGWRRFGELVFRPRCPGCHECRGLRIDVHAFRPRRAHRRNLQRNADVRVELGEAQVSAEHLELYNRYHSDMQARRGWPLQLTDWVDYQQTFLSGERTFGYEFRYYRAGRLAGVALCDVVPDALSAVYFYYDPAWRPAGPGVFSILQHVQRARDSGRRWVHLGYWVPGCPSMGYKAQFRPHDLLEIFPPDETPPDWRRIDGGESAVPPAAD
ncbi:MAG: arginyltransferase [Pirellulales bacterium]